MNHSPSCGPNVGLLTGGSALLYYVSHSAASALTQKALLTRAGCADRWQGERTGKQLGNRVLMERQTFFSSCFQYTFGAHEPTLSVTPPAALDVVCPDSDNMLADGTLLDETRKQSAAGTSLFEGNPLAGPILVQGAEIGDAVKVTIDGILLDRDFGQTLIGPDHGALPRGLLERDGPGPEACTVPRHMYSWQIDAAAGIARLANPLGSRDISVALDPFLGCLGVCPRWGQSVSSLLSGAHGGNMDLPVMKPGATVYLPVYRDGAYVMLGDIHAAQGHGEIIGGGVETSGRALCTLSVVKNWPIEGLCLRDSRAVYAVGVHCELHSAVQEASARLLDWITADGSLHRWDAYHLLSQCVTFTFGGLSLPPYAVAAGMPAECLPQDVLDGLPG